MQSDMPNVFSLLFFQIFSFTLFLLGAMWIKKMKKSFVLACFTGLLFVVSLFFSCDFRPEPELTVPIVKLKLSSTSPQTTVIITWTESTDAEEYSISRSCIKDSINEKEYFSIKNPSNRKYIDTTCEPGVKYTYIVTANATRKNLDSHYYSKSSEEVSITTEQDPLVTLAYPKKVSVKPTENNTNALSIEWEPVQNALSYDVYIKISSYGDETDYYLAGSTTESFFTAYHLYNQKRYSIKIKAFNDQQSSIFSAPAEEYVPEAVNLTKAKAFKLTNSITECFYSEGDSLWFTCSPEKGLITFSSKPKTLEFASITVFSEDGTVLASGITFDARNNSNSDDLQNPVVKHSIKDDFSSFQTGKSYYLRVSKAERSSFSICVE
jgi:hypothetical protein